MPDFNIFRAQYAAARPLPVVTQATFLQRVNRRSKSSGQLSVGEIHDALYLLPDEYKRRYATRRTFIESEDGRKRDLAAIYSGIQNPLVSYANFRGRVKRLVDLGLVDSENLVKAARYSRSEWMTEFGGGKRRPFIYEGDEYPECRGRRFSGVTHLLREIGRYDDRNIIWNRLKTGWPLETALIEPVASFDGRTGSIYIITGPSESLRYIGLTRMTREARRNFHVQAAVTIPWQSRGHSIVSRSKRQFGVANATPYSWCHRFGGGSSPQAELVQSLVLLLLLLDVLPDYRLIATDG